MSRACIPFHILFDKDLSKNELIIYGMIEHMESDEKPVFFNNRSIAEKLGVSHESRIVGKMLGNLKNKGYITRIEKEITFKNKNGTERKELRWCFNTAKNVIVAQCDDDTPPVSEVPPPPVVQIPPPLVPEIPPYNKPLNLDPLNTTTTCSSSFSPFENKCLEFKHSTDDRTDDEFIENVHHHIKLNSDPESSMYQRQQMILKLLRNLHQNAAHFKSKGFVSKQTSGKNDTNETNLELDAYHEYRARIKADITLRLLPKDTKIKTLYEWRAQHVSSEA